MQRDRATGNLIAGVFVHNSSRTLDPQVHSHFTVSTPRLMDPKKLLEGIPSRSDV
jgi:hypothetical protein